MIFLLIIIIEVLLFFANSTRKYELVSNPLTQALPGSHILHSRLGPGTSDLWTDWTAGGANPTGLHGLLDRPILNGYVGEAPLENSFLPGEYIIFPPKIHRK